MTTLLPTELFPIDDDERLFISPIVTDWSLVHDRGIEARHGGARPDFAEAGGKDPSKTSSSQPRPG